MASKAKRGGRLMATPIATQGSDREFQKRLKRRMEEDRRLLERLAGDAD